MVIKRVESEEEKPKKSEKKIEKKTDSIDEDSDEDSNEKKPEKKPEPKKKEQDSDDDDSSEKPKKGNKKDDKKQPPKKESDKEDSDSESEKPRAKETAKKEEDSDSDKELDEPKKQKKDNDDDEELPENAYEELFVRNIGFNTTEKELADFFGNYGDVEEAKIITDKQTGKSKGFGFLKFYEKKSAVAAMNDADNIVVGGRNLQIRYSNDKSGPIRGGGNNGGKKGPQSEFGIFVGNISYKCTENDLKKFFKDCGKVLDVRLAKKPDGKLKGFAHVDFETKEGVDKAVEKNGEELQGRALKIDRSTGGKGGAGGNGNRGGPGGRGGRGREPIDPLAKARKTGGIIAPKENKVTTYDDSSDDE